MHFLQPKHSKLGEKESEEILNRMNISSSQLPKIYSSDPSVPENCKEGDIVRIERKSADGKSFFYYRVVV
jgi:DNA-directed RNA polymerase subunit H (RpoH/RPB5)